MKIPYYQKIHSIVELVFDSMASNILREQNKESKVRFILILMLSEIIGQTSDK